MKIMQALWNWLFMKEANKIIDKVNELTSLMEKKGMTGREVEFREVAKIYRVILRTLQIKIAGIALLGGFIGFLIHLYISK